DRLLIVPANISPHKRDVAISHRCHRVAMTALAIADLDRAVISTTLADIFASNALKVGLLPVELPAADVTRLLRAVEADPSIQITIDIAERRVEAPGAGVRAALALPEHARRRLLAGLDDIAATLEHDAQIEAYEARRPAWLPRVGLR
ncbi:MAG: hypothetical protein AAB295_07455, partial [Chloroflexota bacterium]